MEEILTRNLQSRHLKLIETSNRAKLCVDAATTGILKDELTAVQISLRNVVNQFSTDLNNFLVKVTNPDISLINSYYDDKSKAEDLLTEIEILFSLCDKENSVSIKENIRLPKLELGKYDGNILTWTAFWDKFEANIHNKTISDVEKLSYLLSSLEGSAFETIEGLGPTNINYNIAVDILKNRFGDQRRVVDAHNEALQKLSKAHSSALECRQTLNAIEKHLRVLEAMGEDVNGSHLRVILLSKFPENVLYQVNLSTANDMSVDSIRKALDTVVSALERSAPPAMSSFTPASSVFVPGNTSTEALHVKVETKESKKRKWSQKGTEKKFMKGHQSSEPSGKKRRISCAFCEEQHYSEDCQKYQTYKQRKDRLRTKCYICFRSGHRAMKCLKKRKCIHCFKMHNRALCPKKTSEGNVYTTTANTKEIVTISHSNFNFLQTAVTQVKIRGRNSSQTCRLLLDSGSQRSYMTARLAKKLNIIPDKEDLLIIYTFGSNKPKEISSPSSEITLITKRSVEREIRVNIIPHITERVPVIQMKSLTGIDIIADDEKCGEAVDLLIGNDLYFSFIRKEHFKLQDNVYLIDTDFGWIISGSMMRNDKQDTLSVVTYCQCHVTGCPYFTEPDLPLRDIDVKFLWTLESIGIIDSPQTTHEEDVVKHFNDTTVYTNGRYEVKWPWIQYPPELPTNFGLAYGRLKNLIKRCDQDTLAEYGSILEEQLQASVIEEVGSEPTSSSHPVHYLPHHIIRQEGKRSRIVYDASAKMKNQKSLNECLYSGPCMLEDLTGLLLKFRMGKVGITADVEKAFLQVGLQEEDREVTRFLWVKDPTRELTEDNLIYYRFCRVPFGIVSSPFLLTATIRLHMSRNNEELLKDVADKCYVDNFLISVHSTDNALQIYSKTKKIFNDISMNIRDWMSNDSTFVQNIPDSDKLKKTDHIKILGLIWDVSQDTLQLNVNKQIKHNEGKVITKKDVLRKMARLYDPCGFVSPLILPAKLLFQELCIRKLKWDAPLPDDLQKTWETTVENLEMTKDVKLPRFVGNGMSGEKLSYELHCFADASRNAYAAVAYLRLVGDNEIKTMFLMSKSRVTPVQDKDDLKIPRLELLAYLIGSRLVKYIKSHLDIFISKSYLWTDSQIVLAWMKSNKLLPPFVLRRVNEIKQTKNALGVELCYVNTKANPADIATRPELWEQKQNLWFHGPSFLYNKEENWPKIKQIDDKVLFSAGEALEVLEGPNMIMQGYEDEEMVQNMLDSQSPPDGSEYFEIPKDTVSNDESLTNIKKLQQRYFPDEVLAKETSLSRNLGLFLDVDGVLRSRGRMSHANWSYDKRYPILIPKESTFTNKVIQNTHEDNYHVGVSHTLSILRKRYWIPQGRAQVQKILRKCPQCEKHGGGPYKLPPAPALPAERVNYSTPYTFTGLDYLGPILVKSNKGVEKRWVCLLTCLAVRAVHLEVVNDLTAEECLLAIRRFVALRGAPEIFISDNALQFKLTSEVLTSSFCVEQNIKWKFIAQLAPWQGGFYERLVALVKNCMKRTLDKHLLNNSQLQTIVKEIEAVINTRPLTAVGSELEEVLRPADFLTLGQCIEITPTIESSMLQGTNTKIDLIRGWKRGHMIVAEYKKMFVNQYLPSLRERFKHDHRQPRVKSHKSPQIGDIVQIRDDSRNRTNWKVGKIVNLLRGQDGECRVAKVNVGNSEFTRSIGHLYPLEVESYEVEVEPPFTQGSDNCVYLPNFPTLSSSHRDKVYEVPTETELDTPLLEVSNEESVTQPEEGVVQQSVLPELVAPLDISSFDSPSLLQSPSVNDVEVTESSEMPCTDANENALRSTEKRSAAIKAREKIAEWTRQLLSLL